VPEIGGDPADDSYSDKPKRMRWMTYIGSSSLSKVGARCVGSWMSLLGPTASRTSCSRPAGYGKPRRKRNPVGLHSYGAPS